jgi:hypothetical protein
MNTNRKGQGQGEIKGKTKVETSNGHAESPLGLNRIADVKIEKRIVLVDFDIRVTQLKLVGDSPLICHAWSEKAKRQMLEKQMGVATAGKEKKDPHADFLQSLYPHPDGGYGFPSVAFKAAAVNACTSLSKAITKVQARQAFHVQGELVPINGKPTPREDMVRIGMGTADIRFRGEFKEWSCVLNIRYNARALTLEQIVNLFNIAGFAVGVGEWRPERDGQYGLFHVDN